MTRRQPAGRPRLMRIALAITLVGIGVAMITQQALVRGLEARTGADLARWLGLVPARAVGSAVVFPSGAASSATR